MLKGKVSTLTNMKKFKLCLSTFILAASSSAAELKDFDGDGHPDKLSINRINGDALISLGSSRSSSEKTFTINLAEECGNLAVYPDTGVGGIVVDQSCSGRQAQVYQELYSWDNSLKTWILRKIVRGESMDQVDGILPSLVVDRVVCCLPIESNGNPVKIKTQGQSAIEVNRELGSIAATFKDSELLAVAIKGWRLDMSVEVAASITAKDIVTANDLAYYLWKNSRPEEASIILQKVISLDPHRVVALLNLADSLWDIGPEAFKQQAREYYSRYDENMRSSNKAKLIPVRVQQRM